MDEDTVRRITLIGGPLDGQQMVIPMRVWLTGGLEVDGKVYGPNGRRDHERGFWRCHGA